MGIDAEMFVRTTCNHSDDEIKTWSWHLCSAIGPDKFFINRKAKAKDGFEARTALTRISEYEQDGPTIEPEPGETFIRVHLRSRYYGPAYERGDILTICAVAEWLEQNIPSAEVWYGGDSSGVEAEPFNEAKRREYKSLLYTPDKGRAYYDYDGLAMPPLPHENKLDPPTSDCALCIPDHKPRRYGWGGGYGAYYCAGCGTHFTTRDNGETWTIGKKENM